MPPFPAHFDDGRPKLMFIVGEDWFFASHFLGMAKAAVKAGYIPLIVAPINAHRAALEAAGCRVIDASVRRDAFGAGAALGAVRFYREIMLRERPAVVHCIALKLIVLAGLAARSARVPALVLAPTGLGYLWTAKDVKARLGRALVRTSIRGLCATGRTRFLFENHDDPFRLGLSFGDDRCVFVGGAGVDPAQFPARPPRPGNSLRVAVVARMLRAKGILEAVAAVERARALGADIVLDLWGAPDPANPFSVAEAELKSLQSRPGIAWRGRTDDVPGVWRDADVAMLLSHEGEGLPRSLVEAAASARPIVTTRTPGCREVVDDGVEGFLVPPREVEAPAQALLRLAREPDLRARMGAAARARFEHRFTAGMVEATVEKLYRDLRDPA